VLFRSSREADKYDTHQAQLHVAVADRLSQAIEKVYRIEQLTRANEAYMEMLGFVAHELKSPIGSMVTQAQLLDDGYLGQLVDEQHKPLERIIKSGQYLLGLVDDYLHLSRLETGRLELNRWQTNDFVKHVIKPALEIVEPHRQCRDIQIDIQAPIEPITLCVDVELMRMVVVNLISNAIKYGHHGGNARIIVTSNKDTVTVSVWNEGPGFPPDEMSRLFRRFSRLQVPELLKRKGTGLGLYIVRRIIHAHGGTVWADSTPGESATFGFSLPWQ
jgi:signal transduction histidine kinase